MISDAAFDVTFRVLPDNEITAAAQSGDVGLLKKVVAGWDGVTFGNEPVPFSEASLEDLASYTCLRVEMIRAYYLAVGQAARKN